VTSAKMVTDGTLRVFAGFAGFAAFAAGGALTLLIANKGLTFIGRGFKDMKH